MAEGFLIDTSAVIKYLKENLPVNGLSFMDGILNEESNISFITKIELLAWNPAEYADLNVYAMFVDNSTVIGISDDIISQTIQIRKLYKLKLPDALIAATALANDMALVADNDKDFKKVSGLMYFNPVNLKQSISPP